jgi:D-alanine-D-alanine ligase
MNIVVLAGGLSSERDVSFKSGDMVTKALRSRGHRVLLLDVFLGYQDKETDVSDIFDKTEEASVQVTEIPSQAPDLARVKASRADQSDCFFGPNVIAICRMADVVFMALHGENGENGKLQAAFDLYGIKYTGNGYLSSALAMDKGVSKEFFRNHQIPTPEGMVVSKNPAAEYPEPVRYPCVVKPVCGGSSIGVYIAKNRQEYLQALTDAFCWEDEVVVEDYIQGREFSVGVIEGKALPVIEIAPLQGFYDYKNKYAAGSTVETCPADLSPELTAKMQQYAEEVVRALGLEAYSRMDFLLNDQGEMFCLEANTLPGMTPTSLLPQEAQAVGMSFEELCEKIIEISLKRF